MTVKDHAVADGHRASGPDERDLEHQSDRRAYWRERAERAEAARLDDEDDFTFVDFQEGAVVQEVKIEIHEIRKAMTAENARRASVSPGGSR